MPSVANFDIFRKDRPDSCRGGGVLIATNRNLRCSPVQILSPLEMIWLSCNATHPRVLIGVCYRAPNSDSSFSPILHDALSTLKAKYPNSPILLFGDFNFPSADWSDPHSMLSKNSADCDFVNVGLTIGLSQLVTQATRITDHSSNILDLVLSTHADNFSPVTCLRGLSDHMAVHTTFSSDIIKSKKKKKGSHTIR